MRTLDEVIASRPPDSQERIKKMTDKMILEVSPKMTCEDLRIRTKICEGMSDPCSVSHEEAMSEVQNLINRKRVSKGKR
ncbi:transcriptional regulator [Salmonella enterica]|nr:transcriptional regulator [Salmonella enterica]EHI9910487.1 transcriptional regulator [Salmonella enterica]EHJ0909963.1 transcriptional regulator [Salmonella enterica]